MKTTLRLRGYTSQPNIAAGESVSFHLAHTGEGEVRSRLVRMINGNLNPEGPGSRIIDVPSDIDPTLMIADQDTASGGHIRVHDPEGKLAAKASFSLHLYVWPTLPDRGRQGLISRWDEATQTGWALTLDSDGLTFTLGDQTGVTTVTTEMPLYREVWYSVLVVVDANNSWVVLSQKEVINSTSSVFGRVVPFDGSSRSVGAYLAPENSHTDLIIGGLTDRSTVAAGVTHRVTASYNGKIDAPRWWDRALDDLETSECHTNGSVSDQALIASWKLGSDSTVRGPGLGDHVDEPVSGLVGVCVNQPDRGMTGWNWAGREHNFAHAPEQYGAVWLHEDSLDDCRWPETMSYKVPADLPSGCYALELTETVGEDLETYFVPFFVTPPRGTATAKILILISTFSYLAYGNSQVYQNAPGGQLGNGHITVLEDLDFVMNMGIAQYGLSVYDRHLDGRGVQYSTWRRPLLNMQPAYQHEQSAQVWQYPADLHLICWLTDSGFEFDIATDHDLQSEGASLLSRYNVVLTATHPEYYSEQLIDAWESYLADGGRGMYLGGNGMYWVTSVAPGKPHVIEVRRGEVGDQAWRGRPGELQHSTTGEKGGLWRMRGRAPQKVWGTGYSAHTMAVSSYYEFLRDADDPGLAWIMEGIDPTQRLGDFGLVNGGAAGLEVDRYDLEQGTPPHTRVLASSVRHDANSMLVTEEIYGANPATNGEESPLVRADITYFSTPKGGAMFAVSSMSWAASLFQNDGDNSVARMTANAIHRFSDDAPMPELL